MKTYQDIERELFKAQDSWRHPTPGENGSFPHNPKPEGKIAAESVQFLSKELRRQIGLRDCAIKGAEIAEEALEECNVRVRSRDEYLSRQDKYIEELQDKIGRMRDRLATSEEPPVPTSDQAARERAYESALDTIDRWKDAEREWDAKAGRLSGRLCDLLAEKHVLEMRLVARDQEMTDLKNQIAVNRIAACESETSEGRLTRKVAELLDELTGELEANDKLRDDLDAKNDEMGEIKRQSMVNRIAALAMYQKVKAAAVMAQNATPDQVAIYLSQTLTFHLNGVVEEVQKLNADEREDESNDDQHITDGEEPRGTG